MDPQPPLDSWLLFEQVAFRADQQTLAHPFEQLRCPINLGLEVFGDKWTVLIIRDMMIAGKRHSREFQASDKGISSNILAHRLDKLLRSASQRGLASTESKQFAC